MVDPIGIKAGTVVDRRPMPVGAGGKVTAPSPVKGDTAPVETSATEIARAMAAAAPVDAERVARIKRAIAEGRFPLVPSTVADRLLALKMQWNPHDTP